MLALSDNKWTDPVPLILFNKAESIKQDIELIHERSVTTDELAREAYYGLIRQYKQVVSELDEFAPNLLEKFLTRLRAEEETLRARIDALFGTDEDISDFITRHIRLCDVLAEFGEIS